MSRGKGRRARSLLVDRGPRDKRKSTGSTPHCHLLHLAPPGAAPHSVPPPFRKPQKHSQGSCLPNDEDRDGMVNRCFFLFVFLFLLVPFILFLSPPDNGNNLRTLLCSRLLIISFNFPDNSKGGVALSLLLFYS